MDYEQFIGLAGFPIITALIEMGKRSFPEVTERWWPLVALVLGVGLNVGIAYSRGTDMTLALLVGIVTGLAASGLYSQTKTTIGG